MTAKRPMLRSTAREEVVGVAPKRVEAMRVTLPGVDPWGGAAHRSDLDRARIPTPNASSRLRLCERLRAR